MVSNDNHATTNCHEITKPHFFFSNVPKHLQENEKALANQPKSAKSQSNNILCVHTLIKVRFCMNTFKTKFRVLTSTRVSLILIYIFENFLNGEVQGVNLCMGMTP